MIAKQTIFSTPLVTFLLRQLARLLLTLSGWQIKGSPPELNRCVVVAAPHTSNWDFILMLILIFHLKMDLRWMGKHTLFPWPVAGVIKWLGGIPIDRSRTNNIVDEMVNVFAESEKLILVNTPEGTRSQVKRWKTGFYHIAVGAGVPIQPVYVSGPEKTVGFLPLYYPNGDNKEEEVADIQAMYTGIQGIHPERS